MAHEPGLSAIASLSRFQKLINKGLNPAFLQRWDFRSYPSNSSDPDASDEELQAAYRRRFNRHKKIPDRSIMP
jgi:hypothetical protein